METEEASEDRARVTTGARSLKSLGTTLRSVSGLDSGCAILENAWGRRMEEVWENPCSSWFGVGGGTDSPEDLLHHKSLNTEIKLELESKRQLRRRGRKISSGLITAKILEKLSRVTFKFHMLALGRWKLNTCIWVEERNQHKALSVWLSVAV